MTERILSALVEENVISLSMDGSGENDSLGGFSDKPPINDFSNAVLAQLEERIKQELRNLGLLDDMEISESSKEDDEICQELRQVQRKLKECLQAILVQKTQLHAAILAKMQDQRNIKQQTEAFQVEEAQILKKLQHSQKQKKRERR
eukprot:TRINITY_DN4996_c0_g1_i1.p1 TRINITY_DN4996_c0_g1~~TRINITY_DN4996_c0_g1_i1.p1  ORF type:complete len:147 (-),score=39.94 TRINITY_DN4996_c0_g1_i1:13-453(-)